MGKNGKKGDKQRVQGACLYCNSNEDNELKFGKLIYHEQAKIRVHHYCLLFASGLCQRGEGNEGVEGFLVPDILQEYKRGARLRCIYCKQNRATIGCTIKSCRHMYHFGCGVENKVLYLFYDNFISYCQAHRPQQDEPEVPDENPTTTCPICLETVETKVSEDTLRTPCCTNSWFHRICVQRQALCAGYFFRCGICNNKEDFQREMKQFGIYIPEQDAAWELEDNAYQELYQRHSQCDMEPCICPKGRKYHPSRGQWEVVLCDTCGSRGCHLTCGGLTNQWDDWVCDQCEDVVDKIKSKKSKKSSARAKSPTEKRKEKLMGKSPRTPLPSRKLVKKKAAPSTCPSLSPASPSDSSQLSLHLPSVSASPNYDGLYDSNQCSSSPCRKLANASCNDKNKSQCTTPCKDKATSCRKHLPLSPKYGSPPHFCCTSRDSYAHSHESSIPPSLSVEEMDTSKKHNGHVCQKKYVSATSTPAVKTTSRMSMRGPGTPAFKRAQESFASLAKSGAHHIHHHSLSGVHLCARHRQQVQHSNLAWNQTTSAGSTGGSSHNSSGSSDEIEFGTVHLTPDGRVSSSSGNKHLDVTSGKEAVVQLKPLSNIMPSLYQKVSLGSNNSESQAILGSALMKQVNLGDSAKPGHQMQHTCSKRKLENKEPSAPRKKFKIGKAPPPKKLENKSPTPRKMLKKVPSPQKTVKSSVKKQNGSSPKKLNKSTKIPSAAKKKCSTSPQKTPKKKSTPKNKSTPKKTAVEIISLKQKGKSSPKVKAGNTDKPRSQKKVNKPTEGQKISNALRVPKKKLKLGDMSSAASFSSPDVIMIKKVASTPATISSSLFGKSKAKLLRSPRKSPIKALPQHKQVQSVPCIEETSNKSVTSLPRVQKVVAKKNASAKKVPVKMKKAQDAAKTKQSTLERYLQPITVNDTSESNNSTQDQQSDNQSTEAGQVNNVGKGVKRKNGETPKKTPKKQKTGDTELVSASTSEEAGINEPTQEKACVKMSLSHELSRKEETRDLCQKKCGNPGQNNLLTELLLKTPQLSPKETSPETKNQTRTSKGWNAHMDSGEIVFSRSPPAVKTQRSTSEVDHGCVSPASQFLFKDDEPDPEVCNNRSSKNYANLLAEENSAKGKDSPSKVAHHTSECRLPTRSSPRLMKEKNKKKLSKVRIPAAAALSGGDSQIWVPGNPDSKKTVALATISVDKSTQKSSLLIRSVVPIANSPVSKPIKVFVKENQIVQIESVSNDLGAANTSQDAGGSRKRGGVQMEILYPDGSSSRSIKDRRYLDRFDQRKHTAMSQDLCFREMQEFTQNMLATVNPTNPAICTAQNVDAALLTSVSTAEMGQTVLLKINKGNTRVEKMVPKKVGNTYDSENNQIREKVTLQQNEDDGATIKEENGIPSSASSPEESNNVLVRRSARLVTNTLTRGGMLVRRSRKYLIRERIKKACDRCKSAKKRCFHNLGMPSKKKKRKVGDARSSISVSGSSVKTVDSNFDVKKEEIESEETCSSKSLSDVCSSNTVKVAPPKVVDANTDLKQKTGAEGNSTAVTPSSESDEPTSGTNYRRSSNPQTLQLGRKLRKRKKGQTYPMLTKRQKQRLRHLNKLSAWPEDFHYLQRKQDNLGRFVTKSEERKKEQEKRRKALQAAQTIHAENNQTKDSNTDDPSDISGSIIKNEITPEAKSDAKSEKHTMDEDKETTETESPPDDVIQQVTAPVQQPKEESTFEHDMQPNGQTEAKSGATEHEPEVISGNSSLIDEGQAKGDVVESEQLFQCEQSQEETSSNVNRDSILVADISVDNAVESRPSAKECQLSVELDGEVYKNEHQHTTDHQTPVTANTTVLQQTEATESQTNSASDELEKTDESTLTDDSTDTASSNEQTSSSQSTPSSSPNPKTGYACKKKHDHTPKCKRKHVHYPVCDSPHMHGPKAKQRRGQAKIKKSPRIPIHVHKPKCLAPHLHGPQPINRKRTPKKDVAKDMTKSAVPDTPEMNGGEMVEKVPSEINATKDDENQEPPCHEALEEKQC